MTPTQQLVIKKFKAAGLDPLFGCAIIEHESAWNERARSPITASDEKYGGAYGLCQILLTTAQELGYKGLPSGLFHAETNIDLFIKLTTRNIKTKGLKTVNDLIACHNSGRNFDNAPSSTRETYVPAVLKYYARWEANLEANPED